MSIIILSDTMPKDAKKVKDALPLDTPMICPACLSREVIVHKARTTIQLGKGSEMEASEHVPRMQDRQCKNCLFRWQTVLAPEAYNK